MAIEDIVAFDMLLSDLTSGCDVGHADVGDTLRSAEVADIVACVV
jgi:hypothetical protein